MITAKINMEEEQCLVRKRGRIMKTEKRELAKNSATLAGQVSRVRTAKGYCGRAKRNVKVKI